MGKFSSAPPPTPNYQAIAEGEAESSSQLAAQQTFANRPNQITPWGQVNWSTREQVDPATGLPVTAWLQEETLNEDAQGALDSQLGVMRSRSGLAENMLGRLDDEIGTPLNWDQFGETTGLQYDPSQLRQQGADAAYEYATSRLDPQFEQAQNDLEVRLRSSGLMPGDEAFDREMANFNRGRNDAYEQASRSSFLQGQSEAAQLFGQQERTSDYANALRTQDIAEEMQRRGLSLNEVNALLSGQQVATPQMPTFRSASVGQTPDALGAATAGYQSDVNAYNAQQGRNQGFFTGAANLLSAGAGFLGD